MKRKELTASSNVIIGNVIKPIEELTESEKTKMLTNMSERLSISMSRYYTQHLQEYKAIGT